MISYGEDFERDKQSLALAEKGLASDGGNYQWLWRVARASYFVGDGSDKNDKNRYFDHGIEIGQRAIAQEPKSVEGHFWLAVNYGGSAEQKGALRALSLVKKIRAEMETVLQINDRYQEASAYHALGEIDRQLPRLFGGNLQRSIERLEQGARIAPENMEMKFVLAQAYKDAGRKDDARRQLQEIIARQVDPLHAKSQAHIQDKARQMLAKL
ncbi:MAG: tetratricopeptide repeat protein [Blastocatellia bacterium]|nr:tetratricopeptide repeat protein [Blastocatellia bacterium]